MIVIDNLHNGMNFRDSDLYAEVGDTGVTVGCDFSTPGIVKPLRSGLAVLNYDTNIVCAQSCYIGNTKYTFTTHSDGLYVRESYGQPQKIDDNFAGIFKALVINNSYVVLMNAARCRKWKPGWQKTYMWGLNTPPKPVVTAAQLESKTIDEFESIASWSRTGGGSGGGIALDTVRYLSGSGSMRVTCDSGQTIKVARTANLNLTKINSPGDITDKSSIWLSYYTDDLSKVQSIRLLFSCSPGGGFDKDFYEYRIVLGGYVYATLAIGRGEATPIVGADVPSYKLNQQGGLVREEYDPAKQVIKTYTQFVDTMDQGEDGQTVSNLFGQVITEKPVTIAQYQVGFDVRRVYTASGAWTNLKIPLKDFIRNGKTPGLGWSTITGIRIEVEAINGQAIVNFDDLYLKGSGHLWGYYRVAVAYQNELGNYGKYSEFSNEVLLEGQGLSITSLPIDSDDQTVARRLVILGGSLAQPMVYVVNNNTDSSFVFDEPESSLQEVETYFNNRPPQAGADMVVAFGRVFIVAPGKYGNRLAYSEAMHYEGFPLKNYKSVSEGEQLKQVAVLDDNIVVRGYDREYILQFLSPDHVHWRFVAGSREGAVTNRVLLDLGKAHVYAAPKKFYMSGAGVEGEYLPKITPAVQSFATAIGALAGDKAYVYFKDRDNFDRVMRIDYSSGKPVAHYVGSFKPTSIFADPVESAVYYSLGTRIYKFEASDIYLPVSLMTLLQFGKTTRLKAFGPLMEYGLTGVDLNVRFNIDKSFLSGLYTMPARSDPSDPVSVPHMIGRGIGLQITSAGGYFELSLPIEIDAALLRK